jgi:hypothetical protein
MCLRLIRATLVLLISGAALGQSGTHNPDGLLARLSYRSGHFIDWRQERGNPQICFALYRSGYYRVSRLTEKGTETLQGALAEDQAIRLRNVLESLDFQSSSGAVIRNGAEVLVAEVVRDGKTLHYVWMNPDHQRPFPSSATGVVRWLYEFKPEGASPLTVREPFSICPNASEPVLPLISSLNQGIVGSSCEQP